METKKQKVSQSTAMILGYTVTAVPVFFILEQMKKRIAEKNRGIAVLTILALWGVGGYFAGKKIETQLNKNRQ